MQMIRKDDWAKRKYSVLLEVCYAKFKQDSSLSDMLLATGDSPIVYDSTGSHDNCLGRCDCEACKNRYAHNLYGKALMKVRRKILNYRSETTNLEWTYHPLIFLPEDEEKMAAMTISERIEYLKMLRKMGRYIVDYGDS